MEILSDFQTSVRKALKEINLGYETLTGLVICGTHKPKLEEVDFLLEKIKQARELQIPYLGICYGHQLAAIEYARNVLGIEDATSEEFGVPGTYVVKSRGDLKVGHKDGETYWNNYEIDVRIFVNWKKPEHFFTTQFHPEYESSFDKPHPLLVEYIKLCKQLTIR